MRCTTEVMNHRMLRHVVFSFPRPEQVPGLGHCAVCLCASAMDIWVITDRNIPCKVHLTD